MPTAVEYILFEDRTARLGFRPFTWTRPLTHLRLGIDTLLEKWAAWLETSPLLWLNDARAGLYGTYAPAQDTGEPAAGERVYLNSRVVAQARLAAFLEQDLPAETALMDGSGTLLALRTSAPLPAEALETGTPPPGLAVLAFPDAEPLPVLRTLPDLFRLNGMMIRDDVRRLTEGRASLPVEDPFTRVYGGEQLFIEAGVQTTAAILNATRGPIWLGPGAVVQEGAVIQGPACIGAGAVVHPRALIRPDTTLGPVCKVGGEVSNAVFQGYGNKAHDGFLGHAVIGQWCNLGAGTNNSNLKNSYGTVRMYDYLSGTETDTGLQFCGLFMGDDSKCAIQTAFNTGTIVGVGANVFGAGFPPRFLPSFSWGGAEGLTTHRLEAMCETARRVRQRRDRIFSPEEAALYAAIFEATASLRAAAGITD